VPQMKNRRKHTFVDPAVQGGLVLRIVMYWLVYMIDVGVALVIWWLLDAPARDFNLGLDQMRYAYMPLLVLSILLLPMVIMDIIRFSHRFVGPLLRLRRSMRQLARGEYVAPIKFRRTDFWQDLADEFNAVLERVQDHHAAEAHETATENEAAATSA
jgi:hypothetical protein